MPYCICVDKLVAEKIIVELRRLRLLDDEYRIMRIGNEVLVPVKIKELGEIELSIGRMRIVECHPPRRKKMEELKIPSLDIVGDVVIVRETVLKQMKPEEVVSAIKQIYPKVKAIWVKEETSDTYRTPVLKLLWGEEIREVIAKEYGIKLKVRLGEVYFNPRLCEEHRRLSQLVKNGEVIVDAFSGIGGFSLHIVSSKLCLVIANDVNPSAYELLLENIELNKKKLQGTIIPLNLDAKELTGVIRRKSVDRLIADLPMWSLDFVDIYEELLKPGGVLHLYKVSRINEEELRLELLDFFKTWKIQECRLVMEYAPRVGIYRCDLVKP
ncbi:MAG: methyltransferase [Desulfurococcaceae archaeon]|jgi:tRNA (guanine37-N1)-methyltransferase